MVKKRTRIKRDRDTEFSKDLLKRFLKTNFTPGGSRCSPFASYEAAKEPIREKNLSPGEYEGEIKNIVQRLGI